MKQYKFDKPLIESKYPPKDTNVYWVDVNEQNGQIRAISEFKNNEWEVTTVSNLLGNLRGNFILNKCPNYLPGDSFEGEIKINSVIGNGFHQEDIANDYRREIDSLKEIYINTNVITEAAEKCAAVCEETGAGDTATLPQAATILGDIETELASLGEDPSSYVFEEITLVKNLVQVLQTDIPNLQTLLESLNNSISGL